MADYTVEAILGNATIVDGMTPTGIARALETITTEADKLSFTALTDVPEGITQLTAPEIIGLIEGETGVNALDLTKLRNVVKGSISGCENALNIRGTVNVYNSTGMTNIQSGDFWIADAINNTTNGYSIEDGDWVIALAANTTFDFTDTTKWLVIKQPKDTLLSVLKRETESDEESGIKQISVESPNASLGGNSIVTGTNGVAIGDVSTIQGSGGATIIIGARVLSGGVILNRGDAQVTEFTGRMKTTNATPVNMAFLSTILFRSGKTYKLTIELVAREYGGDKSKSWEWKKLVSRTDEALLSGASGITATVDSIPITGNTLSATLSVKATTPYNLYITCTGLATEVSWLVYVKSVEVATSEADVLTVTSEGETITYIQ